MMRDRRQERRRWPPQRIMATRASSRACSAPALSASTMGCLTAAPWPGILHCLVTQTSQFACDIGGYARQVA
eukprot:733454-Rhodomonas_salina.2